MYPRMVVAVRNHTEYLLELVDAVRRHDGGIFVQEIGQPAEQAAEEADQGKEPDRCVFLFQPVVCQGGKQKKQEMVKKKKDAKASGKQQDCLEQPVFQSCRKFSVFRHQREQGENARKNRRYDGNAQAVNGQGSVFAYLCKTEKVKEGSKQNRRQDAPCGKPAKKHDRPHRKEGLDAQCAGGCIDFSRN